MEVMNHCRKFVARLTGTSWSKKDWSSSEVVGNNKSFVEGLRY